MKVYWNRYMIDKRFRRYKEDLIHRLVTRFDKQPQQNVADFYNKSFTEQVLMEGNSAIICLWDTVLEEVNEDLLTSCAVHYFIDDYMQSNYGYIQDLKSKENAFHFIQLFTFFLRHRDMQS